jgi:hypothetical protein
MQHLNALTESDPIGTALLQAASASSSATSPTSDSGATSAGSTTDSGGTGPTPVATPAASLRPGAWGPSVEELSALALAGVVSIGALELEEEYVSVVNRSGADVSLHGWTLRSTRGEQQHLFPADLMLEDGETLVVWSGPRSDGGRDTAGVKHLVWSGRAMWNSEPARPSLGRGLLTLQTSPHTLSSLQRRDCPDGDTASFQIHALTCMVLTWCLCWQPEVMRRCCSIRMAR